MKFLSRAPAILSILGSLQIIQASPIAQFWGQVPDQSSNNLPPGNYLPPGRPPPPPSAQYKPTYLTIFTEADITFCRPWPNNVRPSSNAVHFFRGTPLNLTCWAHTDIPDPAPRLGKANLEKETEIWVRTEGNGCYINENDLKSPEINYEEFLRHCEMYGPRPLGGNNPLPPTSPLAPAPPLHPATPLVAPPAPPLSPAVPVVATPPPPKIPVPPVPVSITGNAALAKPPARVTVAPRHVVLH